MKPDEGTVATAPTRDALHNLCLADPVWAERYDGWIELGHGGSASVVRTRSRATGEEIALKVFPRLAADEWRRYHNEVRNAQRLSSAHIVRTYSPFPRASFAWIEMEWVEGENLRQELERTAPRPFDESHAAAITASVARALAIAHAEGVVHRDVKPANILLPAGGRPVAKLGDFGLSRLTDAARLTRTGFLVGTPQFAAPEVIEGGVAEPASDVYALCLCLYLMLSGNRAPFEMGDETSPTQWLRAHTDQTPLPIRAHNPAVSAALAEILERGLDKRPAERPTAAECAEALGGLGIAEGSTTSMRVPRPARSNLRHVPLIVAVAVIGGAAALAVRPHLAASTTPAITMTAAGSSATPTRESPQSTPASVAAGATLPPLAPAAPESPLRAELRNGVVVVRNRGRQPVSSLQVTLVAPGGSRYIAAVPEALDPGEDLFLALEGFAPPPPASLHVTSVVVTATDDTGAAAPR